MTVPVLPESAPFTATQRGWLNGFFAGIFGFGPAPAPETASSTPTPVVDGQLATNAAAADDSFPWHDSSLPLDERLRLAEGKPHERQLMAAMAQLDCGSCGYVCQTYAEAIARGEETDLAKCSPGGRETARKLKELVGLRKNLPAVSAIGSTSANSHSIAPSPNSKPVSTSSPQSSYDRKRPFPAPLHHCIPLTKPESAKDVRFVSYHLRGSGIAYEVGDAVGVYPENCPEMVESILALLHARGDEPVPAGDGRTVYSYEALLKNYSITKVNEAVAGVFARHAADASEAATLRALIENDPEGVLDSSDLLDLLQQFPSSRPAIAELVEALPPLQPRLYSISSSLKAHPEEVHLTVGVVRYRHRDRLRKGVASTFMAELLSPRRRARIFIQSSHGFRLPPADETPIIMVGPGTGVAPFRAFLQEREAIGAKGKNWLFFGDQRQESDFLYRDELTGFAQRGVLTRLDTAFSRDQADKIYVQQRMLENACELWSWLDAGAHFYVCGDARRMAVDVDRALQTIVSEQGRMSTDNAKAYVQQMARDKRYQRDVY